MTLERVGAALSYADGRFFRFGRPHRILAGSIHYFRVHPRLWEDRLRRLAALGLNTVDTYVAWNVHERREGDMSFDGWHDLPRFIETAGDLGLDVILRPGPYICAEWSNGGLPVWLTARGVTLRSGDPRFTSAVARWFDVLLPRITGLQASSGGPIVAVQVENEYGSYGDDADYMSWLRNALVERGVTELLFTADGPTDLMLDGGSIDGTLVAATFGSRAGQAAQLLRSRRDGEPFLCAEFWNGWFDHWGERHHIRTPDSADSALRDILGQDGSVSLYMAHGGTNFGLWAGANHDGTTLQPTVTSYDSDAPIAENGALTAKFHAMRATLAVARAATVSAGGEAGRDPVAADLPEPPADLPEPPADLPEPPAVLPETRLALRPLGGLLDSLRAAGPVSAAAGPASFEDLGQASGLVLYRADPVLPPGEVVLSIRELRDRAQVFVNGRPVGVLDREQAETGLPIHGAGRRVTLEVLVENLGRINYGPKLGERKGILGGVLVDRRLVHRWEQVSLPLDDWDADALATFPRGAADEAGLFVADLTVDTPADTFLALPDSVKGFVWVNGFLLGRYWDYGPQVTLYLPAPLLHSGRNTITVLELERTGGVLDLRAEPELGPPEEYVETFDESGEPE